MPKYGNYGHFLSNFDIFLSYFRDPLPDCIDIWYSDYNVGKQGLGACKIDFALCQNVLILDIFHIILTFYYNVDLLWLILFMFGTILRCHEGLVHVK